MRRERVQVATRLGCRLPPPHPRPPAPPARQHVHTARARAVQPAETACGCTKAGHAQQLWRATVAPRVSRVPDAARGQAAGSEAKKAQRRRHTGDCHSYCSGCWHTTRRCFHTVATVAACQCCRVGRCVVCWAHARSSSRGVSGNPSLVCQQNRVTFRRGVTTRDRSCCRDCASVRHAAPLHAIRNRVVDKAWCSKPVSTCLRYP